MYVKLLALDPDASCAEISLSAFPVVLGRGLETTQRLPDRWVSRRHCLIEVRGDAEHETLVVRDLGSTHGTLVNDQQIKESPLRVGDKLTIGLSNFRVCHPGAASDSSADLTEAGEQARREQAHQESARALSLAT